MKTFKDKLCYHSTNVFNHTQKGITGMVETDAIVDEFGFVSIKKETLDQGKMEYEEMLLGIDELETILKAAKKVKFN